jgi:hypothetical protein
MIKNINSALQRLGLTRSNKVICQPFEIDQDSFAEVTRDYSKADHFDAYALCQFLIARELRRHGRASKSIGKYNALGHFHLFALSKQEFKREMRSLSLTTIFDVAKHGRSCSDHIFHD